MVSPRIHGLDDAVLQVREHRAQRAGHSVEPEAALVLADATRDQTLGTAWLALTADLRGADLGLSARSAPRSIDLA